MLYTDKIRKAFALFFGRSCVFLWGGGANVPRDKVPRGPAHVDVWRDLDTHPGGLEHHRVSVDLEVHTTHIKMIIIMIFTPPLYGLWCIL